MDVIIEVLEEKERLVRRRKEIIEQLAGNPREPFCSALEKDRIKTEEAMFRADERFIALYRHYKNTLPLQANGEIDVGSLKDAERVVLKRIRELVREIMRSTES